MDEYDQLSDDQIIALANSQGYGAAPQEMFTPSGATPGAALLASMSPGMGNATSLTGGALGLLDMLTLNQFTGIADNLVAGPNAGIDYLGDLFTGQISPRNFLTGEGRKDYYGERVKQANLMRDVFNERRSTSSVGGLLTALEYTAPMPGKKADAFYDTARALKDAGFGLAAFGGSELGGYLTEGSAGGEVAGALAGPLTLAAALNYKKIGQAVSRLATPLRTIAGNPDVLAESVSKELLGVMGPDDAAKIARARQMPSLATNALGVPVSTTELTQNEAIARLAGQVRNQINGGDLLGAVEDAQKLEELRVLSGMGEKSVGDQLTQALGAEKAKDVSVKSAAQIKIAETLGLTDEARLVTPLESAGTLREYVSKLMAVGAEKTRAIWDLVPMGISVPIREPLTKGMRAYLKTGELTQRSFSGDTKAVFAKAEEFLTGDGAKGLIDNPAGGKFDLSTASSGGTVTIHQLQDLRSAAGQARFDALAAGKKAEARVLKVLIDDIDTGTDNLAAVWGDKPGIEELKTAIAATKQQKVKFESGFTKLITEQKELGESKVLGSSLIRALTRSAEGIKELATKFGPNSVPMEEIKASLTKALEAAKSPEDFYKKNIDKFRAAYGKDVATKVIEPYATSLATKVEMPSVKFANEKEAAAFAEKHKDTGTQVLQLTKGDYLDGLTSSDAKAGKSWADQKEIARGLFGEDYPLLEKVMDSIEGRLSSGRLGRKAAGGGSVTATRGTSWAFLQGQAQLLSAVSKAGITKGILTGGAIGGGLGALIGIPGVGASMGATAGGAVGYAISTLATKSLATRERIMAEMLANPKLIRLAAAPPTKKNLEEYANAVIKLGILGSRSQREDRAQLPALAPQDDLNSLSDNEMLDSLSDDEIEKLAASQGYQAPIETPTPTPTATPTKRNMTMLGDISIVSEAKAEAKPTSNEMARLQKASKGFNVAKAIAGSSKMVQAVSRAESNLKHASISSRGAIGIMQLMPTTAEELGVDPYDPKQNIKGGEKYLEQLRDRFKNDKLTFAAYNMGPNALRIAIREAGTRDWDRIVKKLGVKSDSNKKGIPAETIAYVPKVMKFYRR